MTVRSGHRQRAGAGLLELQGVSQAFSGVTVVNAISAVVPVGQITALVGPNGAGKSTLMNIVAGMQRPARGRVLYGGLDITRLAPHQRARQGIVRTFQMPSEFGRLTVLENLLVGAADLRGDTFSSVFLRRRGSWATSEREAVLRARHLLDRFGLSAKQDDYARDLSGGQRRIVELLRAVIAEPTLLLLDEPFAGVHHSIVAEMGGYLAELRAQGVTILMIAHELDAVEQFCDTVVVMARGAVLYEGTMADARRQQEVVDAYVAG